ncbi:MAG: RSP_7527 family protein [Paracoccaceae bacterium]
MKSFEYKTISPADFRVIEARAHQLRAETTRDGVLAFSKFLKSRFQKLAGRFSHHEHA